MTGVRRRRLGLLAAMPVTVFLLAACQVRTEVAVDVAEDGSGVVMVSVGLDPDAMSRVPGLENELRIDDLLATGWEITGPEVEIDGYTWIRATKPFATPEQADEVLAEIAGEDGPLRDFGVTRTRSFARTDYDFEGTVDFTGGLEAFADEALVATLEGQPLGEAVEAIEERLGASLDESFSFRVAVGLPGDLTSTNAPTRESNQAVWEPPLSDGGVSDLVASSEVVRSETLVFTGVAVASGLIALYLLIGVPIVRYRRRRRLRPRGRHSAPV